MMKNLPILLILVFSLIPSATFAVELSTTPLATDPALKAYYKLENTTDSGPNNYTLTNNGTVAFNPGKYNNAADGSSNNTNKWLNNSTNMDIDGTSSSLAMWVNITTPPTNGNYVFFSSVSSANTKIAYLVGYYNNSGVYQLKCGRDRVGTATDYSTYNTTLATSTWYHVSQTYDSATTILRCYLNGVEVASSTASGNGSYGGTVNNFTVLDYGAIGTFSQGVSGLVDDEGVFNRVLTAAEIANLASNPVVSGRKIRGVGISR